jgi:hypothetical protein
MKQPRLRRKDLPKGANLCEYCTAKCCRYFALPIETPTELDDFNNIRWYLMHGRAAVFVEDGDWYLMVYADCKHLLDAVYDKFFETPEQVWEYAEAVCGPHQPMRKFSPRPPAARQVNLPVLGSVSM